MERGRLAVATRVSSLLFARLWFLVRRLSRIAPGDDVAQVIDVAVGVILPFRRIEVGVENGHLGAGLL